MPHHLLLILIQGSRTEPGIVLSHCQATSPLFLELTCTVPAFVSELLRYLLNEMVKSFLNVAGKIMIG